MDPRRPALRRHAQGAPRPPLRRRAAHPDHRRPRDAGPGRGGRRRDPARPQRPATPRSCRSRPATGYVRAMVGGRDFFGTGPHRQAQPGHPGPPPGGLVVQAASSSPPRSTQGIDPLTRDLGARPASPSRCENAEPWRPCNYGGGGGGTVTIAEGTVRSYNTLYAQLDDAGRAAKEAMEARHALRASRARSRPCPSAVLGTQRRHRDGHGRGLLHLRQPRHPGAARAGHPDHPRRRHRAVQPRAPPGEGARGGRGRHASPSILEQVIERGTGTRAKLDRPAAGKTGTTDENNGRLVRGLHAASWPPPCGSASRARARRQADPDAPADHADHGHRRLLPGGDLAAVHERRRWPAGPSTPFPAPTTTTTVAAATSTPPGQRAVGPPQAGARRASGLAVDEATAILRGGRLPWCAPCPPPTGRASPRARSWCSRPPAGQAPRGSTVTLEVADGKWTAPDAG